MEKEFHFLLNFTTLKEMEGLKRPKLYRDIKYEKLRAIIDCTEFNIEKPSLPQHIQISGFTFTDLPLQFFVKIVHWLYK